MEGWYSSFPGVPNYRGLLRLGLPRSGLMARSRCIDEKSAVAEEGSGNYTHRHETFCNPGICFFVYCSRKRVGCNVADERAAVDGRAGARAVGEFRKNLAHAGAVGSAGETHS